MDELIEMYLQTLSAEDYKIDKALLSKHKISENQWLGFIDLVHELELNEVGARIMLDEIKAGRVVLK
ncbi:MAG: hypothetical protein H6539_05175 [Bacteroidales bacterium]|nr:hypothetical protein [Bacteroidales bacterium]